MSEYRLYGYNYYNYFQRLNQCTGRAAEIMACISDDKTLTNNLFILEDYIGKKCLGNSFQNEISTLQTDIYHEQGKTLKQNDEFLMQFC